MDALKSVSQAVILQVVLILLASWVVIILSQRLIPFVAEKASGRYRPYILATVPVFRLFIIFAAAALVISKIVEPTFENLITILGALGIALGFAFKDYAGSLIAGIVTLYEMPYRIGDWITVEGTYGEVKSIGMRAVEIVTPDDTVVIVPHLKLWDRLFFNANKGSRYLQCVADFYLHPHHDAAQVKTILRDLGLTSVFLQIQRPVTVTVRERPWGTHYRVKAYPVDPRDQFSFITDLTVRGKEALSKLGVEFSVVPPSVESRP